MTPKTTNQSQASPVVTLNTESYAVPIAWLDKANTLGLKGIYKIKGDSLSYCFAQPGEERPASFEVAEDSGHTTIRLKRFTTGEEEIEKELSDAGVTLHKDEVGWITNIRIERKPNSDDLLSAAAGLKKLDSVTINASAVSSTGLKHLSSLASLRSLSIKSESDSITGLESLSAAPHLYSLSLSGDQIDDQVLLGVSQLKQIRKLELQRPSASSDALRQLITALPSLTRLDVDGAELTSRTWSVVAGMQNLATLSAAGSNVTDQDLVEIRQLTNLTGLLIQNTETSDEGFGQLVSLSKLDFLRIDGTRVTNRSLKLIARSFPNLRTLYMQNLDEGVTDEGLLALGQHPRLNYIYISNNTFSQESLEKLRKVRDDLRVND